MNHTKPQDGRNRAGRALRVSVSALALAGLGTLPAKATETIDLSIVSGFAPSVAAVKLLQESFMPNVADTLAETGNYQINWQEAFSGTLAQPGGELEAIQTGLADVGVIVTGFHADRLPLYQIGYATPFVTTDLVLVHEVVDALVEEFPAFNETWDRFNQVTLSASGIPDNYVVCSVDPIETKADLDGMRIAGIGPNLRWVEPIGAVGVTGSLADFYNMADTGVVDAMLVWGESAVSMNYYEVCPYYWDAGLGGANTYTINVNQGVWERLPEEVQDAMTSAAKQYGVDMGVCAAELGQEAVATFEESGGQVSAIDEDERLEWAMTLPNLAVEWADRIEDQGMPGHEILSAYMQAMRDADQPIARQWDQED